MRFDGFLGNERIKSRLSAAADGGALPQFFLIAGPVGSGRKTLARILAAAMQCTAAGEKPCGVCPACRKVFAGMHPDVITVTDSNKYYSVATIRDACASLYIRPNEGQRKIYLFPQSFDPTRAEAQNALLKVTEEPPGYGAFLILTENAERMLATVRSRAVVLTLSPLDESVAAQALHARFPDRTDEAIGSAVRRSGGWLGQAISLLDGQNMPDDETAAFAAAFATGDALALLTLLAPMEKYRRDQLQRVFEQWISLLTDALSAHAGAPAVSDAARTIARGRTGVDMFSAVSRLREAMDALSLNVSPAHVCGALSVYLRRHSAT